MASQLEESPERCPQLSAGPQSKLRVGGSSLVPTSAWALAGQKQAGQWRLRGGQRLTRGKEGNRAEGQNQLQLGGMQFPEPSFCHPTQLGPGQAGSDVASLSALQGPLYRDPLQGPCPCTEGWASQESRPALVHSSGWAGSFCIPLFKKSLEISRGRSRLPIPNSRRTGSIRLSLVSELDPLSARLCPQLCVTLKDPGRRQSLLWWNRAPDEGSCMQLAHCLHSSFKRLTRPSLVQQEVDGGTSGR